MNIGGKKIPIVIGVVALLAVAVATSWLVAKYWSLAKLPSTEPTGVETEEASPQAIPTLTPERKEIISQLETHVVTIQNKSFSPANLTIKLHDQVEWQNKDNETYQIKGEGWGNIPIEPGESFSQAFETAGTFPYSCSLHPELTGTIVVE